MTKSLSFNANSTSSSISTHHRSLWPQIQVPHSPKPLPPPREMLIQEITQATLCPDHPWPNPRDPHPRKINFFLCCCRHGWENWGWSLTSLFVHKTTVTTSRKQTCESEHIRPNSAGFELNKSLEEEKTNKIQKDCVTQKVWPRKAH